MLDGLYLWLRELPVDTTCHFHCLPFIADANDRSRHSRLPQDPGKCQVNQLFVMVPGNGLKRTPRLFKPGVRRLLGIGAPTPEIMWIKAILVKTVS